MNVVINYCLDYTLIPVGEYDNTTHTVIGVLEVGTWARAIFTDKQGFSQMWNDWVELYSLRSSTAMFVKEGEQKKRFYRVLHVARGFITQYVQQASQHERLAGACKKRFVITF